MAAGEQGATPRHKPTLFLFIDFCRLCLDLICYQMAFSPICSVVCALGLVRLISRCYAVPQCSMHPSHCQMSARARFANPVRIPLRPCLPCSYLHHAILLVIALFMSRHYAYRPAASTRIPPSSCYWASFLTDNTSGISCHVRRFIRHVDNSCVITGYSLDFP